MIKMRRFEDYVIVALMGTFLTLGAMVGYMVKETNSIHKQALTDIQRQSKLNKR